MKVSKAIRNNKIDPGLLKGDSPFRNRLLVAMPGLQGGFFTKSVVYVCAHSPDGAMGIIINQKLPDVQFADLFSQLQMPTSSLVVSPVVHCGGPVETGRGFVLHSTDFMHDDTVRLDENMCITGTVDILSAMALGKGPHRSIFALGYAGWGPGQLEEEVQANAWLTVEADDDLIFSTDLPRKWEKALAHLGIDPTRLSFEAGNA